MVIDADNREGLEKDVNMPFEESQTIELKNSLSQSGLLCH